MTYVDSPPTSAYAPPALDFSWLANLPKDYYQGQQQRQQSEQSQAFKNGLPMNPDGSVNYSAVMQTLAKLGDVNAITALGPAALQQQQRTQAATLDPMLSGAAGTNGAPGTSAPGGMPSGAPPASAAASIPTSASTPGDQIGVAPSVEALAAKSGVSDTVAANIARALKVQPNAPLNAQQWQAAQKYLQAYIARTGAGTSNGSSDPIAAAGQRVASIESGGSYSAVGPVTANGDRAYGKYQVMGANVGPWTKEVLGTALTPQQFLQNPQAQDAVFKAKFGQDVQKTGDVPDAASTWFTGRSLAQGGANATDQNGMTGARYAADVSGAAPSQGGGQQPLVPQVPLPRGFTDPQQAILALRTEAAKLSVNPQAGGQVDALNNWASRIESSLNPVKVTPTESLLDPRTGKPIYQGPWASGVNETKEALDADAQRYLETGTLPPNMGRGVQGAAQSTAIRQRAEELAESQGIDPATLPQRWQQYRSKQTGMRVLEQRAANLELAENESKTLIPRVLDASSKVSRTQYPTLNSVIMAAEKGTGDPNVVRLGVAASSLIYVYARVLKPTGVLNESDTRQASEILNKAWSQGQIEAALDQMVKEINAAKTGLAQTQQEYEGGSGAIPDVSTSPAPAPAAASAQSAGAGRPTITNAQGQKMILSSDGKSWVPVQ